MHLLIAVELVFQIGPHGRCRVFRTQGDAPAAAVGKGIHFLRYHIGGIADPPLKQLRRFKHRRTDFSVSVAAAQLADNAFHIIPFIGIFRENILRAS